MVTELLMKWISEAVARLETVFCPGVKSAGESLNKQSTKPEERNESLLRERLRWKRKEGDPATSSEGQADRQVLVQTAEW